MTPWELEEEEAAKEAERVAVSLSAPPPPPRPKPFLLPPVSDESPFTAPAGVETPTAITPSQGLALEKQSAQQRQSRDVAKAALGAIEKSPLGQGLAVAGEYAGKAGGNLLELGGAAFDAARAIPPYALTKLEQATGIQSSPGWFTPEKQLLGQAARPIWEIMGKGEELWRQATSKNAPPAQLDISIPTEDTVTGEQFRRAGENFGVAMDPSFSPGERTLSGLAGLARTAVNVGNPFAGLKQMSTEFFPGQQQLVKFASREVEPLAGLPGARRGMLNLGPGPHKPEDLAYKRIYEAGEEVALGKEKAKELGRKSIQDKYEEGTDAAARFDAATGRAFDDLGRYAAMDDASLKQALRDDMRKGLQADKRAAPVGRAGDVGAMASESQGRITAEDVAKFGTEEPAVKRSLRGESAEAVSLRLDRVKQQIDAHAGGPPPESLLADLEALPGYRKGKGDPTADIVRELGGKATQSKEKNLAAIRELLEAKVAQNATPPIKNINDIQAADDMEVAAAAAKASEQPTIGGLPRNKFFQTVEALVEEGRDKDAARLLLQNKLHARDLGAWMKEQRNNPQAARTPPPIPSAGDFVEAFDSGLPPGAAKSKGYVSEIRYDPTSKKPLIVIKRKNGGSFVAGDTWQETGRIIRKAADEIPVLEPETAQAPGGSTPAELAPPPRAPGGGAPNKNLYDPRTNPSGETAFYIGDINVPASLKQAPGGVAQFNQKTWYHGSGTGGIKAQDLDPNSSSISSLFGEGVYLTDNPNIAKGYAKSRGRGTGEEHLYEAKVNVGKVLDLDKPATPELKSVLDKFYQGMMKSYTGELYSDNILKVAKNPNATGEQLYLALVEDMKDFSVGEGWSAAEMADHTQGIRQALREAGFDALAHTGGKRTGNAPHQVLIVLDPNDQAMVGRSGHVSDFTAQAPGGSTPAELAPAPSPTAPGGGATQPMQGPNQIGRGVSKSIATPRDPVEDRLLDFLNEQIPKPGPIRASELPEGAWQGVSRPNGPPQTITPPPSPPRRAPVQGPRRNPAPNPERQYTGAALNHVDTLENAARRSGNAAGRKLAEDLREVVNDSEASAARPVAEWNDDVRRVAANPKALAEISDVGGGEGIFTPAAWERAGAGNWKVGKFQAAVDGNATKMGITKEEAALQTPEAQALVQNYWRRRAETGFEAERLGVKTVSGQPVKAQVKRFIQKPDPSAKTWMVDGNDEFEDFLKEAKLIYPFAEPNALRQGLKAWASQSLDRPMAIEFQRSYPMLPAARVSRRTGELLPVIVHDVIPTANNVEGAGAQLIRGEWTRLSGIKHLGQDVTLAMADDPRAAAGLLNELPLGKALAADPDTLAAAESAIGAVYGRAEAGIIKTPVAETSLAKSRDPMVQLVRVAMNRAAPALNLGLQSLKSFTQTLGEVPAVTGVANYAKAVAHVAAKHGLSADEARLAGALHEKFLMEGSKVYDRHRLTESILNANVNRFPTERLNDFVKDLNDTIAFTAGKFKAEDMLANGAKQSDFLLMDEMNLPQSTQNVFRNPAKFDDAARQRAVQDFGRRVAQETQFHSKNRALRGRFENDQWIRYVMPYLQYSVNTLKRTYRDFERVWRMSAPEKASNTGWRILDAGIDAVKHFNPQNIGRDPFRNAVKRLVTRTMGMEISGEVIADISSGLKGEDPLRRDRSKLSRFLENLKYASFLGPLQVIGDQLSAHVLSRMGGDTKETVKSFANSKPLELQNPAAEAAVKTGMELLQGDIGGAAYEATVGQSPLLKGAARASGMMDPSGRPPAAARPSRSKGGFFDDDGSSKKGFFDEGPRRKGGFFDDGPKSKSGFFD